MNEIKGGTFVPLYGSDSSEVMVNDFLLDTYPVTNQEFLEFVKSNEKWKRSKVIKLFADGNYLTHWVNDTTLANNMLLNAAVTNVSWYVAKDYCAQHGKRLPSMDEWEFAAMASETQPNAQADSIFNQQIIEGYETPKTYAKPVGSTFKNYWGVYDMHGLVWEWTMDFNSVLISGESRQDVDSDANLFCGGAAVNSTNLMNYAAFMRYAMRGSIKAKYCIRTLGFRCAKNVE
ncbi:MAG: formylglycine-generating enzyme family protein [Salibacteraceae bacterium]